MKSFQRIGFYLALYGMAVVLIWIGIFKFTPTEAAGIKPLVLNSFVMRWMYELMSQSAVSNIIGSIEIVTGVMLLLHPVSANAGMVGGALSTITFMITLSFIFTTPGAFGKVDGVWIPDQFLLKDLLALGVSITAFTTATQRQKQESGKNRDARTSGKING